MRAQRDDIGERLVRLRGTKRRSRERDVPIVTDWQGTLVGYALEHARGTAPMLFKKKPDEVRCAVRYAARRAGIDHCTPNDLRRTYSTWLRAAGAHLDTIAPTMGHADTRMLQRTYARLPPDLLAARLATEMAWTPVGQTRVHGLLPVRLLRRLTPRNWCPGAESNHRHGDFQSHARRTVVGP